MRNLLTLLAIPSLLFNLAASAQEKGGAGADKPAAGAVAISSPVAAEQFEQGQKMMQAQNLPAAAACFRKVIGLSPDFAPAYLNLGTTLAGEGKSEEAIAIFSKAKSLKGVNPIVYLNLGTLLHDTGKVHEAIDNYKRLLEVDPNGPYAHACADGLQQMQEELAAKAARPYQNGATDYFGDATSGGASRWAQSEMPLRIFIDAKTDVPRFRAGCVDILKAAIQDWVDASQGKIKIEYVSDADKAQIICRWSDAVTEMASPTEPGNIYLGKGKSGIVKCDITLRTTDPAGHTPFNDAQTKRIAQHEVGHALGLVYHSTNPLDVMGEGIPGRGTATTLSARDKNTILKLYDLSDGEMARFLRK
ncbi:MAG: tetratricopeptide repeat protein [Cyanobacteria bacterium REEB67]|nr:tetratricopeptide repeat protein [Cyanobacteria bacterium REEB67]